MHSGNSRLLVIYCLQQKERNKMTNKLIAVATLICMLAVMLVGKFSPSEPLFYFISLDPAVTALRLSLVGAMLIVAFKDFVNNNFIRRGLAGSGISLMLFGVIVLAIPSLSSFFIDHLMPLDALLIIETGVVFAASAFDRRIEPKYHDSGETNIPVRLPA